MPTDGPTGDLEIEAAQYREEICAAIRQRTGNPDLAEDIAQETLLRVIARLRGEGLADPSKLENFMYRVAGNVLRENRRRDRRQVADDSIVDGVEAPSEDQFEHRCRSEESRLMWQSLQQIGNEGYREVLIRFYLRQEDKRDICAALNLSPREFTQRIFRAKESLRKELKKSTRRHGLRAVE